MAQPVAWYRHARWRAGDRRPDGRPRLRHQPRAQCLRRHGRMAGPGRFRGARDGLWPGRIRFGGQAARVLYGRAGRHARSLIMRAARLPELPPRVRPPRHRGFTLVELMVAMTIGLLVMGTAALAFTATSRNRSDLDRAARLNEDAQYAVDFLGDELGVAAYFPRGSVVGCRWQRTAPFARTLCGP